MTTQDTSHDTTDEPATPTELARECLGVIRKGWAHVLDPIKVTSSGGSSQRTARPATEAEVDEQLPPDARFDTPRTLAFWAHAAVDAWPSILDRPQHVPQPTTDPATYPAWTIQMYAVAIDIADIYAMVDLLDREADRLATWVDGGGHDFGVTFVGDLVKASRAVARVAWPPKGDRMTIGECPACDRRIRVKAPTWRRVPQPTTDPDTYGLWSDWHPERDKPIACRCGLEDTIEGWRERLAGPSLHLTAEQLVADIREQFGITYQPLTIRTWQRRGMIQVARYADDGRALYDRTQVLAALMAREKVRDRAS